MMNGDQPEPAGRIDAYLDGLLTGADRDAFEREITSNAELRRQVESQRRIDESMRRLFAPPEGKAAVPQVAGTNGSVQPGVAPIDSKRKRPRPAIRVWPIAAAVAIGLGMAWWLSEPRLGPRPQDYKDPGPVIGGPASRDLQLVYADQERDGFKPDWQCKTRDEFARTFEKRFGVPIVAEAPAGTTVWGLSYKTALSRNSVLLLGRVDEHDIVVFVDRESAPAPQDPAPGSGMNLFRRKIRDVMLYELTPLKKARLLPLFHDLTPSEERHCPERR